MQPVDTRKYRTSWRLTFRFDGQQIALTRRERLQKVAPGTTSELPTPGKNSGAWLVLLNRDGQPLFHRLLSDPLHTRAEHHSQDRRIELHVRSPEPCEFSAVVPEIPDASEVVLYSSPVDHKRMFEPATEVGRFPLVEPKPGDDSKRPRRPKKERGQ